MSRPKLGELLLQNGLITAEQLSTALQSQVVNAGRLGSNVVELGFTSVDALSDLLAFQLGVPAVGPADLSAPDPRVLAAIPAAICGKYKLLPFRLLGQTLHVAMQDPLREDVLEYLRAGLRVEIKPYVAPQLRLLYFLERYYEIPRPKRFLRQPGSTAPHDERRTYLQPTVAAPVATPAASPVPPPAPAAAPAAPARPRLPGGSVSGSFELVYLDEVPRAAANEAFDVEVELPDATAAVAGDELLARIDQATTRETLIQALVEPVTESVTLSLLVLLRNEMAVGLAAWGTPLPQKQVRGLVVPTNTPSLLQRATASRAPVRGTGREDDLQAMIATYLRAPAPQACCVVPVMLLQRVINLICVQSKTPLTDHDVALLQRIGEHAAAAYERLVRTHQVSTS
ncbi:MAG: GAF domain-containing protein [Proteobacteria bacterium]|nr:GAF domain-containing protein [Pseudomonadota bacterium]